MFFKHKKLYLIPFVVLIIFLGFPRNISSPLATDVKELFSNVKDYSVAINKHFTINLKNDIKISNNIIFDILDEDLISIKEKKYFSDISDMIYYSGIIIPAFDIYPETKIFISSKIDSINQEKIKRLNTLVKQFNNFDTKKQNTEILNILKRSFRIINSIQSSKDNKKNILYSLTSEGELRRYRNISSFISLKNFHNFSFYSRVGFLSNVYSNIVSNTDQLLDYNNLFKIDIGGFDAAVSEENLHIKCSENSLNKVFLVPIGVHQADKIDWLVTYQISCIDKKTISNISSLSANKNAKDSLNLKSNLNNKIFVKNKIGINEAIIKPELSGLVNLKPRSFTKIENIKPIELNKDRSLNLNTKRISSDLNTFYDKDLNHNYLVSNGDFEQITNDNLGCFSKRTKNNLSQYQDIKNGFATFNNTSVNDERLYYYSHYGDNSNCSLEYVPQGATLKASFDVWKESSQSDVSIDFLIYKKEVEGFKYVDKLSVPAFQNITNQTWQSVGTNSSSSLKMPIENGFIRVSVNYFGKGEARIDNLSFWHDKKSVNYDRDINHKYLVPTGDMNNIENDNLGCFRERKTRKLSKYHKIVNNYAEFNNTSDKDEVLYFYSHKEKKSGCQYLYLPKGAKIKSSLDIWTDKDLNTISLKFYIYQKVDNDFKSIGQYSVDSFKELKSNSWKTVGTNSSQLLRMPIDNGYIKAAVIYNGKGEARFDNLSLWTDNDINTDYPSFNLQKDFNKQDLRNVDLNSSYLLKERIDYFYNYFNKEKIKYQLYPISSKLKKDYDSRMDVVSWGTKFPTLKGRCLLVREVARPLYSILNSEDLNNYEVQSIIKEAVRLLIYMKRTNSKNKWLGYLNRTCVNPNYSTGAVNYAGTEAGDALILFFNKFKNNINLRSLAIEAFIEVQDFGNYLLRNQSGFNANVSAKEIMFLIELFKVTNEKKYLDKAISLAENIINFQTNEGYMHDDHNQNLVYHSLITESLFGILSEVRKFAAKNESSLRQYDKIKISSFNALDHLLKLQKANGLFRLNHKTSSNTLSGSVIDAYISALNYFEASNINTLGEVEIKTSLNRIISIIAPQSPPREGTEASYNRIGYEFLPSLVVSQKYKSLSKLFSYLNNG